MESKSDVYRAEAKGSKDTGRDRRESKSSTMIFEQTNETFMETPKGYATLSGKLISGL